MDTETNQKNKNWINWVSKYLYVPIIAPVIVAVILSFLKISKLENKIEIQNSVIQNSKIEINKLKNNVVVLGDSIQMFIKCIQNNTAFEDKTEIKQEGTDNTQTNNIYK